MNTRCQELGLNNRGGRRTSKRERKSDKRIKKKNQRSPYHVHQQSFMRGRKGFISIRCHKNSKEKVELKMPGGARRRGPVLTSV